VIFRRVDQSSRLKAALSCFIGLATIRWPFYGAISERGKILSARNRGATNARFERGQSRLMSTVSTDLEERQQLNNPQPKSLVLCSSPVSLRIFGGYSHTTWGPENLDLLFLAHDQNHSRRNYCQLSTAMNSPPQLTFLPACLEDVRIKSLPSSAFYIAGFLSNEEEQMLLNKVGHILRTRSLLTIQD
jgi:hypothetical protein